MAVKGFNIGGSINRYDFNSLVNKEGAVTADMLGSDVTTQLTTMSSNISTLQSQVATLNDGYANLGGFKIVLFSTTVTIPSGTSALVNYDVSYASVSPGSGYRLIKVLCRIGNYDIPYLAYDLKTATWIYKISNIDRTFTISNTATAWTNYELNAILFFKPV